MTVFHLRRVSTKHYKNNILSLKEPDSMANKFSAYGAIVYFLCTFPTQQMATLKCCVPWFCETYCTRWLSFLIRWRGLRCRIFMFRFCVKESNTSTSLSTSEYSMEINERGCVLMLHDLLKLSPSPIISIEYEHKTVLYWFCKTVLNCSLFFLFSISPAVLSSPT